MARVALSLDGELEVLASAGCFAGFRAGFLAAFAGFLAAFRAGFRAAFAGFFLDAGLPAARFFAAAFRDRALAADFFFGAALRGAAFLAGRPAFFFPAPFAEGLIASRGGNGRPDSWATTGRQYRDGAQGPPAHQAFFAEAERFWKQTKGRRPSRTSVPSDVTADPCARPGRACAAPFQGQAAFASSSSSTVLSAPCAIAGLQKRIPMPHSSCRSPSVRSR